MRNIDPEKDRHNLSVWTAWFEKNASWAFRTTTEAEERFIQEYPTLIRSAAVELISEGKLWVNAEAVPGLEGLGVITGQEIQELRADKLLLLCQPMTQTRKSYRKELAGIEETTDFTPDEAAAMTSKEWKARQLSGEDAINEFKRRRPEYADSVENGKKID